MKRIAFIILTGISLARGEEAKPGPDLSLSLSTIKTEAEKAAVGFAIDWTEQINVEQLVTGDGWLTQISPDVKIQTGDKDSFNGILAKVVGYHAEFQTTRLSDGTEMVDNHQPFSVFPFTAGVETNRDFSLVNSIAEVGYIPFARISPDYILGLNPAFGIFIQGGYKFDSGSNSATGGAADESDEDLNSGLFRVKLGGKADFSIIKYDPDRKFGLSLLPEAWVWYDILNGSFYHKVAATLRTTVAKDKFFDLEYEHGSGAPNFNTGDQFSAGLTINF